MGFGNAFADLFHIGAITQPCAAYGAGIFTTFAVIIVGLTCIALSSKSCRSTFSTILTTTRNEELDVLVTQERNKRCRTIVETSGYNKP